MDSYELCPFCNKPLITEGNLTILRKRLLMYVGGGTLLGGLAGAAMLPLLGFGSAGVASGSVAASWQSSIGLVSAGSTFALLQSLGATGTGILLFGAVGSAAGGGALGLIASLASKFRWCECRNNKNNTNNKKPQMTPDATLLDHQKKVHLKPLSKLSDIAWSIKKLKK